MATIVGIIVGACTLSGVGGSAVLWAADQRYVQQEALAYEFDRQRLEKLGDEIFELELKDNRSSREEAILQRKQRQYEDLRDALRP